MKVYTMFLSISFMVLAVMSPVHFYLTFKYELMQRSNSTLRVAIQSSSTACEGGRSFFTECSGYHCEKLIDRNCVRLFLDFVLIIFQSPTGVSLCQSHTQSLSSMFLVSFETVFSSIWGLLPCFFIFIIVWIVLVHYSFMWLLQSVYQFIKRNDLGFW